MPNGGSDNCGTCGFNSFNDGNWEYKSRNGSRAGEMCQIRGIELTSPFGTYCINWDTQDRVPEGPVFTDVNMSQRVPWFHGLIPTEVPNGTCVKCAREFESVSGHYDFGVQLIGHDGSEYRFCCAKHYISWWRTKHGGQKIPYYNYLPRSITLAKKTGRSLKKGIKIRRHWWEIW